MAKTAYNHEYPILVRSADAVELQLAEAEKFTASIMLRAEDGRQIEGVLTSSHRRILLAGQEFSGTECEILYGIDTKGLRAGDEIRGEIRILSNLGEESIPVHVDVTEPIERIGLAGLEDFAELARTQPREAFRMFTGEDFETLLTGKDAQYRALYRGMSANPVTYEHLEEFLVGAGRKKALQYSTDRPSARYFRLEQSERDTLYVYKNTWGFGRIEIEVIGDFIKVPKKQISTEDFVGRVFTLDYMIDHMRLGRGIRRGRILLHSLHDTIEFEILATRKSEDALNVDQRARQKRVFLANHLLDLQMKRLDYRTWYDRSREVLESYRNTEKTKSDDLLIGAWLAFMNDNTPEAMEYLWPIKEGSVRTSGPVERAVYLTLAKETGLLPDEDSDILAHLRDCQRQMPGDYILMYLVRREQRKGSRKARPEETLSELEQLYENGCNSPFMYLEALLILEDHDSLLRRLSPFMLRVLSFARSRKRLTEKILMRAAFLSHSLKRFSRQLYHVLAWGYEQYPSRDVLEAVCRLIIKGYPAHAGYDRWYRLAIEQDIRITRIYEYYMGSVDADSSQIFPMQVLLYFSEGDSLSESRRALLYASVIRHRDIMPEIYQMYRNRMRSFAEESLKKGMINDDFAVLYQTFFAHPQDARSAALLSEVLFTYRLDCFDPNVRRVIVCHDALREEERFPVTDGTAWIRMYQPDACIIFEDSVRRRFQAGSDYEVRPLLRISEGADACMNLGIRNAGLLLYGCGVREGHMRVDDRNLASYRMASEMDVYTERYRKALRRSILTYYLAHPDDFGRIEFAGSIDPAAYAAADKPGTVSLLMEEGKYREAFDILSEFGYENVPLGTLLQLSSRMITAGEGAYDEELLYLTSYVYGAGKYDDTMLQYLRDHYDGPVNRLCGLWEKLRGFCLDTLPLEEKILRQSVFCRTFPGNEEEVLQSYWKSQGSREVIASYLGWASHVCMLGDRGLSGVLRNCIRELYASGNAISSGMKLAWLKSVPPNLEDQADYRTASELLGEMSSRGIRFGFFREFPPELTQRYRIEDKVFVEVRCRRGAQVIIEYRIRGREEAEKTVAEPMRELYPGIFGREFLLFCTEELIYSVFESDGGARKELRRGTIRGELGDGDRGTRYQLLNRMLYEKANGTDAGFNEALDAYLKKEAFVESFLADGQEEGN